MLQEQLAKDLIIAMKAKDEIKVGVLRFLQAAIKNAVIDCRAKGKEIGDAEILEVMAKQVKQRNDSISQYKIGGREDLAQKEEAEKSILQSYLPAQMSEDEVRELVEETLRQLADGAKGAQEMGKVMAALMPKVKGKADGQMVSRLVKEALAS
mgnify:CR=1 FL=1